MKLARVSSNKGILSRNAKTQTQGKNMVRDRISFASRLKELRMIAHISQIELAEQLHVSRAAVANWETGRTRPDIANIPALCSLLDISIEEFFSDSSDPDSNAELRLLSSYRKLPSAHRAIVLSMTEQLLAAERSTRIDPQNVQEMQIELVQLPMADDAVAAGFNLDDFSAHCKQVYLHSSPITRRADLIFHVNGDSMEPAFPKRDDAPRYGEVGIFQVDNALFIKEYRKDGLASLNPKWPLMQKDHYGSIQFVGQVVGLLDEHAFATREEIITFTQKN